MYSVNVNTRAKGNPMKAVREGSIIFRFERPTSRKSAKCNKKNQGVFRDRNHRINLLDLMSVVICEASQILTGNSSIPNSESMHRAGQSEFQQMYSKRPEYTGECQSCFKIYLDGETWQRKGVSPFRQGRVSSHEANKKTETQISNWSFLPHPWIWKTKREKILLCATCYVLPQVIG